MTDWDALKQEFIVSDKISLKKFAELKGLNYNSYFSRKTKGWIQERNQRLSRIREKVMKEMEEKQVDKEVSANEKFSKFINCLLYEIEGKIKDVSLFEGAKGIEIINSLLKSIEKLYSIRKNIGICDDSDNKSGISGLIEALRKSREMYNASRE